MNTQIEDIVKALKSAREERKALELRLSQITSTEVAIKQELVETYKYLGDFLEGEGIIKKPSFPKIHTLLQSQLKQWKQWKQWKLRLMR